MRGDQVAALARQADGKLLVAGENLSIWGIPVGGLGRLTAEGLLDGTMRAEGYAIESVGCKNRTETFLPRGEPRRIVLTWQPVLLRFFGDTTIRRNVEFAVRSSSVREDQTNVVVTLSRGESSQPITVGFKTVNDTAEAGLDYTASPA